MKTSGPIARHRIRHQGFTLVELLVVIGIIALLISILLPALGKAREASREVVCASNQRQLMLAFLMFANEHQGRLPGNYWDAKAQQKDPEKRDWLIGDNPNQGSPKQILDAPQNGTIYRYIKNPDVYRCPSFDSSFGLNRGFGSNGRFDYAAFIVFSGARVVNVRLPARFKYHSGPLNGTYASDVYSPIICEEEPQGGINGGNMEGGHCNTDRLAHVHRGGGNYATIDGSVHWFKEPKDHDSWDWSSQAPSRQWVALGNVPIPGWGWWDRQ